MKLASQIKQPDVASAVVKPNDAEHFVLPAINGPFFERAFVEMRGLIGEILGHQRYDTSVSGGFLILRQNFEHDEVRPPILILRGADPALRGLVLERPVDPLLHFGDEDGILGQKSKRHQAIEKIRTAFPAFAATAEPAGVRTEIGPKLVQVAGKAGGLELQLIQQPTARFDCGEAQAFESVGSERCAIGERVGGRQSGGG